MASTRASISKASKRPKINIIPPKQLFVYLTHDDSKTPSPKHQLSSASAPNAPSKTPSTKGISSSSIDYTPKSPTLSTSPSTNSYLNSPTSPPPRVPPPPPTQENTSMDITLTLLPITPLDVQCNTPLPSPPIFGHLIPWNLLEAHAWRLIVNGNIEKVVYGIEEISGENRVRKEQSVQKERVIEERVSSLFEDQLRSPEQNVEENKGVFRCVDKECHELSAGLPGQQDVYHVGFKDVA
ncbi:hypothetical protein Tco_1540870 [Tanacetum coccineum]